MTQLHRDEVRTKEVLEWKGIHLLHFSNSSCSQKTRIFLNLKRKRNSGRELQGRVMHQTNLLNHCRVDKSVYII